MNKKHLIILFLDLIKRYVYFINKYINRVYNLPLIRILRVIGGFLAVLVLTKNYLYLPNILH
jgi:hypothetical protein